MSDHSRTQVNFGWPISNSDLGKMIKICLDIISDHRWDFLEHKQILVGQNPMMDCIWSPVWQLRSWQNVHAI